MLERKVSQEDMLNVRIIVNEQGEFDLSYSVIQKEDSRITSTSVYIVDFVLALKEHIYQHVHPLLGKISAISGIVVLIPINYVVAFQAALQTNGGDLSKAHQEASLRVSGDVAIFEGGFAGGFSAGKLITKFVPKWHPAQVVIPIGTGLLGGFGALPLANEYEIKEGQSSTDLS